MGNGSIGQIEYYDKLQSNNWRKASPTIQHLVQSVVSVHFSNYD